MMPSNSKAYALSLKEVGVSKHFPITHLNDPTIFETRAGEVGSVIECVGIPFDTATTEELNAFQRLWHHTLSLLGESFCVTIHTVRQKENLILRGAFPDPFTEAVNQHYQAQFQTHHLYRNRHFITILYKRIFHSGFSTLSKKIFSFSSKNKNQRFDTKNSAETERPTERKKAIQALEKARSLFLSSLDRWKPHLLGSRDEEFDYSELLSFLAQFVNGFEWIPFRYPTFIPPFQKEMEFSEIEGRKYPEGNISHYLPAKRLFFGEAIQFFSSFQPARFATMISLKQYGTETSSVILDGLLRLDAECVSTHTFAMISNAAAQHQIQQQLIRLENAKDPAISQQIELQQCRDDVASGRLKIGLHHHSVMIFSNDLSDLKERVQHAIKIYNDLGSVAVSETLGLEPAFWAQIPGNQKYIARSALITSKNFVDFCPLHTYRTGYRDRNHLGEAVTLIETPAKTPLFFNYHSKGSGKKNDLTPGHTTIIGGNGSGKTVFMGFMDSQMSRYGGKSFFFDRDRGMEIYVRATGGRYVVISPDYAHEIALNPFQLEDVPKNRLFLKTWLSHLVKAENEQEVPAEIAEALSACVDYAYDVLEKKYRCLRNVTHFLPLDFPRFSALSQWLHAQGTEREGEYAYLFDHEEDQLDFTNAFKIGFDLTELLSQPKRILTAVCMYLMHRVQASLNGQRVSIYFDEGWQILDNDYWRQQLKQDLPTLRKLNAHIVLATQSPESVVNSALSAQFLDNAATNIFFCNPQANYEKHYRHFHVLNSEFQFIKETSREKRLFLYKQSDESMIGKLNLSGMDEALAVYSANKNTIQLLEKIRAEVGDDPSVWMPIFQRERRARGI